MRRVSSLQLLACQISAMDGRAFGRPRASDDRALMACALAGRKAAEVQVEVSMAGGKVQAFGRGFFFHLVAPPSPRRACRGGARRILARLDSRSDT